jgi:outer membrane lipoprotein-sorting protein
MNRSLGPRSLSIGLALAFAGVLASAADLPKGETLLDQYIEVTGGKAAYAKIHGDMTTGTIEFKAMGLKGKLTVYSAEPDKEYTEISFEGIGKTQEGSNGEVAWSMSTMQGPHVKEGDEKAEALLQAKFNADLTWRDLFKSVETVAVETVDGKECYKVVLTPKAGSPITHWYGKESNLLVKMSSTSKSPMGEIQADSLLSDYRKEGDVLVAHKVVLKAGTVEMVMTLESVHHNPDIPKGTFEIPGEVQALLKKSK